MSSRAGNLLCGLFSYCSSSLPALSESKMLVFIVQLRNCCVLKVKELVTSMFFEISNLNL